MPDIPLCREHQLFDLQEAADTCGVAKSTIHRWVRHGCHGVKLTHRSLGRRLLIPAEALERFMREAAASDYRPRKRNRPQLKLNSKARRSMELNKRLDELSQQDDEGSQDAADD